MAETYLYQKLKQRGLEQKLCGSLGRSSGGHYLPKYRNLNLFQCLKEKLKRTRLAVTADYASAMQKT